MPPAGGTVIEQKELQKKLTEPAVFQQAYDLTRWYAQHMAGFPKTHRFTLGDRIENGLLESRYRFRWRDRGMMRARGALGWIGRGKLAVRARAKMRQHDRSGAFSLDGRGTTLRKTGGRVNPEFWLGLSQPIRAAPLDFVSPRVRRNSGHGAGKHNESAWNRRMEVRMEKVIASQMIVVGGGGSPVVLKPRVSYEVTQAGYRGGVEFEILHGHKMDTKGAIHCPSCRNHGQPARVPAGIPILLVVV